MNLFRNLLFWIALALAGALIAQFLLAQDPGHVLVRWRGYDYTSTVLMAAALLFAALFALWLLWTLLAMPFRAWGRHRDRRLRARIGEGFDALHQGHYARARKLLVEVARDKRLEAAARIAAARAAHALGDDAGAEAQLQALGDRHPASRAIASAEFALQAARPGDALHALDLPAAQPLPPRGLRLRAEALAASGRSAEACGMLGALRQQQALPTHALARCERDWTEAMLRDAPDANALAERWDAVSGTLRSQPGVAIAYATRASALHWHEAAASSLEHALDAGWDEGTVACYANLQGPPEQRRARLERWQRLHPASPALAIALARIAHEQGQWPMAEDHLHRAIAQGAGADAWEALGDGFTANGDDTRACHCYANALRAARGQTTRPLEGRTLRQTIGDEAVAEERDQHGIPRLKE